jgi:pimeloyl-ACP methyl ester carboxylesterase
MIQSNFVTTDRIKLHYLEKPGNGDVLILIHGNGSSSVFWKELMGLISDDFRIIAPDMRGYGETEDLVIDATRGFDDFADDLNALLESLNIEKAHFAGHSLGGGMLFAFAGKYSEFVKSLTLVNPASPFGFGGSKGETGIPCNSDFSGSGGGVVNPEFVVRLKAADRTDEDGNSSPRAVMNTFYWKPPFVPQQIEELLDSLLSQKLGEDRYPGDFVTSDYYPFVAPGKYGPMNAGSPKYLQGMAERFIEAEQKFPVLWIRGAEDQIVSNDSFFDLGTLGKMGAIPNYPGEDVFPPQPMLDQTRYVLKEFEKTGGSYTEIVMDDTAHSPFIEKPKEFLSHFEKFIK